MNNATDNTIIQITDSARTHLQAFIAPLGEQAGFRIAVKKSGCSGFSYLADIAKAPQPQDICVVENKVNVFIDANSVDIIRGTIIDLQDKGFGQKQLAFNNPNAEAYCGCGESFTLKDKKN